MTPAAFKQSRQVLGLSQDELARLLRLNHGANAIREMETGKRSISGPVSVCMELLAMAGEFVAGYEHMTDDTILRGRPYDITPNEAKAVIAFRKILNTTKQPPQ